MNLLTKLAPFLAAAVLLSGSGCAADAADSPEDGEEVESTEDALSVSQLEIRGSISADACVQTAGMRNKGKYIAFRFDADAGDSFVATLSVYAYPDLRIYDAAGKQIARGKTRFEGDGVDGGFLSEVTFSVPRTGSYFFAIRDRNRDAGQPVPAWLNPILTLDDAKTHRRANRCSAG